MGYGDFLTSFFNSVWSVFQLRIPVINLSFSEFYIGIWVIGLGIFVVNKYFGFGGSSDSSSVRPSTGGKRYRRRQQEDD